MFPDIPAGGFGHAVEVDERVLLPGKKRGVEKMKFARNMIFCSTWRFHDPLLVGRFEVLLR